MSYQIDARYLTDTLEELVKVDSPVGYYADIHAYLRSKFAELGYEMTVDNKATAYVRVPGKDSSKSVCLGAHLDTIGLIVRGFNDDGTLRVRMLGGINYHAIEGETCYIHCRDGRVVNAQVICNKHSVHVFEDCRQADRDENNMSVSVIGDVYSPADARALGITEGAIISIDPHFESFDNGYIVSRHIDDKAAVAALIDILKWFKESGEKPAYDTLFAFPMYEEIGHGGAFVPADVSEYVAVDITLIGPDYDSNEHHVGVIASDAKGPYDWDLTNQLIRCAQEHCDADKWDTQVCFHYSTDANAASHLDHDIRHAAFGMACMNSHGRERCHVDAIVETEKLARAYVMGECQA
ncbi:MULTISPECIES: M20/M25/M40 family metallo-hydrolase [Atopobiaceae]|uniref:Aminopeptidase FrvX n=1 Tax=Parafannyhessea umbonata TaxID=604330 RepID=A0A1H9PFL7_9ACTN|nr:MULTISPECIES: M20/M25/M40 family metallo-hydrolase [Atopobiaceae]SEH66754.1 Putative aminopeptidase FrvX [Parafannyhessea umbonata]SER46890.1 Putative aminopeptidase FrvX [Parafannyhessea umbonata]SJZ86332.1 Putative aminopeptidase FrvX [Olsenella sp. KH1P3]